MSPEEIHELVEQLRALSSALIAADIDMQLPEGSINPEEAADALTALSERLAEAERVIADLRANKTPRCAECHGDGVINRSFGFVPCEACNGKGF